MIARQFTGPVGHCHCNDWHYVGNQVAGVSASVLKYTATDVRRDEHRTPHARVDDLVSV